MKIVFSLLLVLFLAGCAGGPATAPEGTSAEELVQRAQEASGRYQYGLARGYYELILERFPYNMDMVCTAEYEIGFIGYKQRKYDEARERLDALLARYEGPDAVLLPPKFRRLSTIVLAAIDKKAPRTDTPQ